MTLHTYLPQDRLRALARGTPMVMPEILMEMRATQTQPRDNQRARLEEVWMPHAGQFVAVASFLFE